jgi:hypothetical protein
MTKVDTAALLAAMLSISLCCVIYAKMR